MRYSRTGRARQPGGRRTLTQRALAILAKYGSAANLYLPGIGAINGITAGNWLDSNGTTAATVDGQVGLVVSAGKAVGPELVSNGSFNTDLSGWSAQAPVLASWTANGIQINRNNGSFFNQPASQISLVAGESYRVSFSITSAPTTAFGGVEIVNTSRTASLYFAGGAFRFSAIGTYSAYFTATATENALILIGISGDTTGTVTIDNVSVRALTGAHLTQSTAANRPILRRGLVNLLTQSDFQNGVTDAPTRAGLVTASTIAGYGGALAFGHDGSTLSYAYKNITVSSGMAYTFACIVKMDDGLPPSFLSSTSTSSSNTFAISAVGMPTSVLLYSVISLGSGLFMVLLSGTSGASSLVGVVKYASNDSRTFKVTRYALFAGTVTAQQILAAGGIPITTTAPASSASGPFAWQFDGSNDSFTSTLVTGNEGWVCTSAKPFVMANQILITNGANLANQPGISLKARTNGEVWFNRSDGSAIDVFVFGGPSSLVAGVTKVVGAAWTATGVVGEINGVEVTRSTNMSAASSASLRISGSIDATQSEIFAGTIGATIIMPTVLPTAAERATLRKFIASLSGVTM